VFWAYRGYHLVDSTPAFAAAIVITIAAMAYAVLLDEVLVAILSLLGGYATRCFCPQARTSRIICSAMS
jgi:uncharacterized membrane protein